MLRIPEIELIPPCDEAAALAAEHQSDAESEPLGQARDPNDILGHDRSGAPLLDAKFLETANRTIVGSQHLTSEQPIQTDLARPGFVD
jgi:hypothetical protein